jgi:phosphoserine phosphatase RsbU/P
VNPATASIGQQFRPQLLERRARLQNASGAVPAAYLRELLAEVDAALHRIDNGSFGICETCGDAIEVDRLQQDPLTRFCLDHLSPAELRMHEQDLALAAQIQGQLLPSRQLRLEHWDTHYRYQPFGAVGGDYCELMPEGDGHSLFFAVGDVAGKGVAASLLMTHLSAIFRSLLSMELPLPDVIARANRLFCESTAPSHYATLVCGRATASGIELCNAGHCTPLLLRREGADRVEATGLPLGLFCGGSYPLQELHLGPGDCLVVYSDGVTESHDPSGLEYGVERLLGVLQRSFEHGPQAMVDAVLQDLTLFRQSAPVADDLTMLILRRH